MKKHKLVPSMSRVGNCHDNAVSESLFATIKKRIIKRKIYSTREDAKAEICKTPFSGAVIENYKLKSERV
ncbi:hypothetical protein PCIT_a0543 [Pseudoalteromonas citrea]|uniref:Integrase catalytic domain-containing protein n=2 Tax=Pseudoalteromonas citrea TaxID=43655 RepID=A0AAD4FT19_9GAMM|nr:hypothetical protein PCIT_a0543 [Pseudoalteromonas citrea]